MDSLYKFSRAAHYSVMTVSIIVMIAVVVLVRYV